MRVCHVGTLPYQNMGTLTHAIVERCVGEHAYVTLDEVLPDADVYVLECFKKRADEFAAFKAHRPIISLIHSSAPCVSSFDSQAVVALTHWSARDVSGVSPVTPRVIPGYVSESNLTADYNALNFGRVSRNAPGKFHPLWTRVMHNVLGAIRGSKCTLILDKIDGFDGQPGVIVNTTIGVHDTLTKFNALAAMSVAAFAHGDFMETFCVAALECMAVGLPIVYLYQSVLHEVIGESQACCSSLNELEDRLVELLLNPAYARQIGYEAKKRAREFSLDAMVSKWNNLFEEVAA